VQCGGGLATELFDKLGPEGTAFARSRPSPPWSSWRSPGLRFAGSGNGGFREVIVFAFVLFGMNCCFYAAIDRIPLGSAVTFEFIGPLGIAIWGSRSRTDLVWARPRSGRDPAALGRASAREACSARGRRWRSGPASSGPATSSRAPGSGRSSPASAGSPSRWRYRHSSPRRGESPKRVRPCSSPGRSQSGSSPR
jgi:hypothetical protein